MTRTNYTDAKMVVESGWRVVGFHHLPQGFSVENIVLLLKKGGSHRSAVIRQMDLDAMINNGVLLEVHNGSQFCYPYIKIDSGGT